MTREELFEYIEKISDPDMDRAKILANLHYTHFYLMEKYKKILEKYDLTPIQSNVLSIIAHKHPQDLALEEVKAMVLEPSSDVSRIVARLTQKGFAEKVPNRINRRKICIRATRKGIEVFTRMKEDKLLRKFTDDFSLNEARKLVKLLKKLRK